MNSAQSIEFRGISFNAATGETTVDGALVQLTSMELALLTLFITRPGETLSRDQILKQLRGIDAHIITRSVDVLVSRLRQKLQDTGRSPRFIATVWGAGYRFIAETR